MRAASTWSSVAKALLTPGGYDGGPFCRSNPKNRHPEAIIIESKNNFKKLAEGSGGQLKDRNFVLNCDVVSFTAAVWQSATRALTFPQKSGFFAFSMKRQTGPANRDAAVEKRPTRSQIPRGYPLAIGWVSRKLESGASAETMRWARLPSFFNQMRLLGQDYAFYQL